MSFWYIWVSSHIFRGKDPSTNRYDLSVSKSVTEKFETCSCHMVTSDNNWWNRYDIHMIYDIWYILYCTWYMVYYIWYMKYFIWYIIYGISYIIYHMSYIIFCISYIIYRKLYIIHLSSLAYPWLQMGNIYFISKMDT